MRTICFLSDYGLEDAFVGVCHGVIKRINPQAALIDISHGVPAHDVFAGALMLRDTLPYMPAQAVHLAVVDPGVGSGRRAVALRSRGDRLFVGPDNGLLTLAAAADGGVTAAAELNDRSFWLEPVSSTFHGRDIFAPVAAGLAAGLGLAQVGRPLDPSALRQLSLPGPRITEGGAVAAVIQVDRFGNLALDLTARELEAAGLRGELEILCRGQRRFVAQSVTTFCDVPEGLVAVLVDSFGHVAICVNGGSAAQTLSVGTGDVVGLTRRQARG